VNFTPTVARQTPAANGKRSIAARTTVKNEVVCRRLVRRTSPSNDATQSGGRIHALGAMGSVIGFLWITAPALMERRRSFSFQPLFSPECEMTVHHLCRRNGSRDYLTIDFSVSRSQGGPDSHAAFRYLRGPLNRESSSSHPFDRGTSLWCRRALKEAERERHRETQRGQARRRFKRDPRPRQYRSTIRHKLAH
jgi:hypothetical protein